MFSLALLKTVGIAATKYGPAMGLKIICVKL